LEVCDRWGTTVVVVTHDPVVDERCHHRIRLVDDRVAGVT